IQGDGNLKLEVDFSDPDAQVTTLTCNARVGVVFQTPNPLGPDFGELAGTLVIETSPSGDVALCGAVDPTFEPATLADYGLDVEVDAFMQINTTATEQEVTIEYFDGALETVTLAKESFQLYLKGDIGIGTPADPTTHLLDLDGFLILEIDG